MKLTGLSGCFQRVACISGMSSRKYCLLRGMTPQVRVICLLSLLTCVSVAKGLDISSGRVVPPTESSLTGSEKTSGQVSDFVSTKDQEKRTVTPRLNQTGSLQDTLQETQKAEDVLKRRRDVLGEKRNSSRAKTAESKTKNSKPSVGDDEGGLKTWEQLWNEQALPPSLPTSDLIDADDYYTYDYFEDAGDDEDDDEDTGGLSVDRSKKDTSSSTAEGKSHSLDRLAELVTGANPQMGLVNLGTPNPDIEITIEVLDGDEVKHDADVVISMDLRDDIVGTPPAPASREHGETGAMGGRDHDNDLAPPTSKTDTDSSEPQEGPEWEGTDDDEDSYYSFEFVTLRRLPDPDADNFEPDDPEEKKGTWTGWSPCSASCGGGRSERSRSCGFSCTATESKDCNQQSCPRRGKSESRTDTMSAETPQLPSLNTEYLHTVLDPENFDTDSCEEWMGCRSETLLSYLSRLQDLPDCPCFYPTNIQRNNAIWDRQKRRMFRWTDASGEDGRLDVYKPTASYCIISLLSPHSTSLAAQQCCYDGNERLITRGPGAGTPQLISAEISPELHYKIDIMPWIICKGDWTKYNKVRHPNNMRECRDSPDQADFYHLFQEAKNF